MARLFCALNFPEDVKDGVCRIMESLKPRVLKANFTRRENLHLTLVFIGETGRVADAVSALGAVKETPFKLTLKGFGNFGDISWLGVGASAPLMSLYGKVRDAVVGAGFAVESRPYRPHLTLAREVTASPSFDAHAFAAGIPEMTFGVNGFSLMKSERIRGVLVYRSVADYSFAGA